MAFADERKSLPYATILKNTPIFPDEKNNNNDDDYYGNDDDDDDDDDDQHRFEKRIAALFEAAKSSNPRYHYPKVRPPSSKQQSLSTLDNDDDENDTYNSDIGDDDGDDDDGVGTVWKKIRAVSQTVSASTNYIPSRKLLGAYPGDAVPIEEAADANGVIGLAARYGYGDWSDDDDDDQDHYDDNDDDDGFNVMKKKRRRRRRSGQKRRQTIHTDNGDDTDEGQHKLMDMLTTSSDHNEPYTDLPSTGNNSSSSTKRRRKKTTGTKKRRRRLTRETGGRGGKASISFGFGSMDDSFHIAAPTITTRRRHRIGSSSSSSASSGRRRNRSRDTITSNGTVIPVPRETFHPSERKPNILEPQENVRLPMERTRELNEALSNKRSGTTLDLSRPDRRKQPNTTRRDTSMDALPPMRRTRATFNEDKKDNS